MSNTPEEDAVREAKWRMTHSLTEVLDMVHTMIGEVRDEKAVNTGNIRVIREKLIHIQQNNEALNCAWKRLRQTL